MSEGTGMTMFQQKSTGREWYRIERSEWRIKGDSSVDKVFAMQTGEPEFETPKFK